MKQQIKIETHNKISLIDKEIKELKDRIHKLSSHKKSLKLK